jgi:dolichol kinase
MTTPVSTTSLSYTDTNGAFRRPLDHARRTKRRNPGDLRATKEELHSEMEKAPSLSSVNNDDESNQNDSDKQDKNEDENTVTSSSSNEKDAVISSPPKKSSPSSDSDVSATISSSSSASRWKRRKQIAMGLVASIATTVGAAKAGWLGAHYTESMIARDAFMTGLTSVLAVAMNRSITWGFENGKYDSKTGRKLTHILSAPLFIVTWPFFSAASGARIFAGLVTLTNMYRLYLAGTGDAAESSLANTISRSGDKSEVLGGPFIYVCLFQLFIMVFWRDSFPGVVAMTTMAAGDGMADIIGRRYGRNRYKWPFGDGKKSLVGTVAFAVFAFGLTLGITSWLIATGALTSSLAFPELARNILAISCICALVEVLPIGDDNYTVPGSAALLAWLWLR